jgi:hypothetical protein
MRIVNRKRGNQNDPNSYGLSTSIQIPPELWDSIFRVALTCTQKNEDVSSIKCENFKVSKPSHRRGGVLHDKWIIWYARFSAPPRNPTKEAQFFSGLNVLPRVKDARDYFQHDHLFMPCRWINIGSWVIRPFEVIEDEEFEMCCHVICKALSKLTVFRFDFEGVYVESWQNRAISGGTGKALIFALLFSVKKIRVLDAIWWIIGYVFCCSRFDSINSFMIVALNFESRREIQLLLWFHQWLYHYIVSKC